jgi:hypothetical protein
MMNYPKCNEDILSMSVHYCPAKEKADDRLAGTPCSPSSESMKTTDTPETDNHEAERDQMQTRASSDYFITLELCRKLERERDEAIADAANAVNDIIAVRYQRDQLAAALEEMRYGHTDKAESMAIAALSYMENSVY